MPNRVEEPHICFLTSKSEVYLVRKNKTNKSCFKGKVLFQSRQSSPNYPDCAAVGQQMQRDGGRHERLPTI